MRHGIVIHDPDMCEPARLQPAVEWLRSGGVVAFPTDTLYALAVDSLSPLAVQALFDLKGRGAQAALPFVAADRAQVERLCGPLPPKAARLAERFWPGPLSLVLDAPATLPPAAIGGGQSIAIRVPAARLARMLASAWGAPLPATSANKSGEPAAASPAELSELASDPRVFVIDAGATPGGLPSTMVDARGTVPVCVREGAIAWRRVLESLQGVKDIS